MTHTSGLTYGFHHTHAVDEIYRANGYEWGTPPGLDLAACCDAWAGLPLAVPAGRGVAVLGRDRRARPRRRGRLGPVARRVPRRPRPRPAGDDRHRVLRRPRGPRPSRRALRARSADRPRDPLRHDGPGAPCARPTRCPAAAASCPRPPTTCASRRCSSAAARLDGMRLLGPRTLAYMARNHLPGGVDLDAFGRPLFAETTFEGVGFGLGFSVVEDPVAGALAVVRGRVRLGRRREHGVLDRPGRAARRPVPHAAPAVEHAPDPPAAAPARPPGDR